MSLYKAKECAPLCINNAREYDTVVRFLYQLLSFSENSNCCHK